ncbi:unnamed protein product, partial [Staurois parvus]
MPAVSNHLLYYVCSLQPSSVVFLQSLTVSCIISASSQSTEGLSVENSHKSTCIV